MAEIKESKEKEEEGAKSDLSKKGISKGKGEAANEAAEHKHLPGASGT